MSPEQCKMARAGLGWGVRDLAAKAAVSTETVVRFESGEQLREQTLAKLKRAFERAGVELIAENGGGPGVRLAKRKGKAKR
jgi:ribosome-binding protein aMBF1 (putative translation factor)